VSLLSDFTTDCNQDLISVANVESSLDVATVVEVLTENNPSQISIQSKASSSVEYLKECTLSVSENLCSPLTSPQMLYVPDDATGEEDSTCTETAYLDFLELQTSDGQQMWPTFKEACQLRSARLSFHPSYEMDRCNSGIKFSEKYLKVAGLTNINLEELVDTSSILLSVRDAESEEIDKNSDAEKRARRKDFFKVMTGGRQAKRNHCRESEKSWRDLVSFDTGLIMKEIEFITDFIYCKYECPAVVQKFLQYNFWQNRLINGKASTVGTQKERKTKRGTNLAHKVTCRNTQLSSVKRKNFIFNNPPVEEISRTVAHQHVRRCSLEPHSPSKKLRPLKDLRETLPKRTINNETRESLELWSSYTDISQESCELETWRSESGSAIDLFDGHFFNDDQNRDGVKQWLTLSEWWLKESLDVSEMLQLVD